MLYDIINSDPPYQSGLVGAWRNRSWPHVWKKKGRFAEHEPRDPGFLDVDPLSGNFANVGRGLPNQQAFLLVSKLHGI